MSWGPSLNLPTKMHQCGYIYISLFTTYFWGFRYDEILTGLLARSLTFLILKPDLNHENNALIRLWGCTFVICKD